MTDVIFGRLTDLPLRDAWAHEAHAFTPWLARNIDHLSEVIGVPLELTGTEVAVETFSADILARNPQDDSIVLIENQLEATDHTHLGQIMTYLAGLEAQTVVWIAPNFREPHLSAIRWLNEHTADGFSFFAVRLRVVRIADSPFAPIFEIVEQPNDWDRQLAETKRGSRSGGSEIGAARGAYWDAYVARHPETRITSSRLSYDGIQPDRFPGVTVCVWIGQSAGGIFVRGDYGDDRRIVVEQLEPLAEKLSAELDAPFRSGRNLLAKSHPGSVTDPATWPDLMDWQERELRRYIAAFDALADERP